MSQKSLNRKLSSSLLLVIFSFGTFSAQPVSAKLTSRSEKAYLIATTSWGAVITTQGTSPKSAVPYTTAWSPLPGTQIVYLDAVNYGTLDLTGQTFAITTVDPNSSRQNSPKITFDACVGAPWDANTNTCAGTITAVGTSSNQTVTSNIFIPQSGRLSMRLTVTKTTKVAWSTTLNITVSRAQVRAGTTQNS